MRSYSTDVLQLFQLEGQFTACGPKIDGSPTYSWKGEKPPIISISCDEWADRAMEKLRGWDEMSAKTRKRKISSLSGFLNWLKNYNKIDLGILLEAPSGKQRKLPHFISVDECLGLIRYLQEEPITAKKSQQTTLFYLLYGCGLRVSEACQIRWDDLSFSQKTIKILGKGGRERLAIMPSGTLKHLQGLKRQGNFVFGNKALPTRTAYERVREMGKAAGLLKPIHPHALRHSYATHLLSDGSDLRILQQLLGHQSLAATELYTHLDIDQLANTMQAHHPLSKN